MTAIAPPLRRRALLAGIGLLAGAPHAVRAQSAGAAYANDLVAAARKEGQLRLHAGEDAALLAQLIKGFQASFPGIDVQLTRADTLAALQPFIEAQMAGRHEMDVLSSTDLTSMVALRRAGKLALFVPEETRRWPLNARDPDGFYAFTSLGLMVLAYNTRHVPGNQAPASYTDLLGVPFTGKLVIPHPGYSSRGLAATFLLANALGWPFFEQLARQGVLQVQSAAEAADKVASGERHAMLFGSEQTAFRRRAENAPIAIVYPDAGTAAVPCATAVLREAPHPNAARLFATWMVNKAAQEIVAAAGARSFHPDIREPTGRVALSAIKTLAPDPILLSAEAELVQQFYTQLFPK